METRHLTLIIYLRYSKLRQTLEAYWTTACDVGGDCLIGNCNVQNASRRGLGVNPDF